MKKKILIDATIQIDPPSWIGMYGYDVERRARAYEEWAKEFEAFVRDHRSQDPIRISIDRQYQYQCSHCGYEWETDPDGCPVCCQKAQDEFDAEKANAAT